MGKKAKTPPVQSQTATTEPWEAQKPYLEFLFGEAKNAYQSAQGDTYPNQTVAPVSQATTDAQQNLLNAIIPMMQASTGQVASGLDFGLNGAMDIANNPALQGAIDAAVRPVQENLTQAILPQIRANAVLSGNLGSSRQGIAEGLAMQGAQRQAGDIAARMGNEAYMAGLDTFERSLALAPGLISSFATPELTRDAVGQQERQIAQDFIDEDVARHFFEQNKGDQALANYAQLISGNWGGTTEGTGTTNQSGKSGGLLSAIGGATSGFQLASSLVPGYGWVGAGIGALSGLLG